ncbi:hypothetical protein GQX74_003562 [Glossina fuscipes]|nr:hypothetical protein GQX74_003562 [Glossina fuscipes]
MQLNRSYKHDITDLFVLMNRYFNQSPQCAEWYEIENVQERGLIARKVKVRYIKGDLLLLDPLKHVRLYVFTVDIGLCQMSYKVIIPLRIASSSTKQSDKTIVTSSDQDKLRQSVISLRLKTQILCKHSDLQQNNSVLQSYEEHNYNDLDHLTTYQTPDL